MTKKNRKRDKKLLLAIFIVIPILAIFLFQSLVSTITYFVPAEYYFGVDKVTILISSDLTSCGQVNYTIDRISRLDTNIDFVVELTLINEESTNEVQRSAGVASLDRSRRIIELQYKLPCDIDPGNYYITSTNIFSVNGVEKVSTFETPVFKISN